MQLVIALVAVCTTDCILFAVKFQRHLTMKLHELQIFVEVHVCNTVIVLCGQPIVTGVVSLCSRSPGASLRREWN